ncbi:acyl-CoA thioesterase [Flavihumibacter sp. RY-1]|uniref:Acyl-CoA thioesterase n=1 Tax=Flavihumibacter fluminis TaxID=2909236 RepID=A0ABS9BDY0_9BACT|nr:acyl-CoA thioesterase [Flavihumibacter fluminis]MCF1713287.1 acyl-CoA thioesterase [Flavihumibacter fluminis]
MKELKKIVESKTRIHYQDCDPFNHLNNSRYIDYMMEARTEQLLANYDFNMADFAFRDKIGWVAVQNQISYLYPATWMEVVTIQSRLIQFSDWSVTVEALMWDEHKTKLKSVLWSKLVHFNIKTQKSHQHSAELMFFFTAVHFPLPGNQGFEERIKALKELPVII